MEKGPVNACHCPSLPISSLISFWNLEYLGIPSGPSCWEQVQPRRGPALALSCEQTSPNDRTTQCHTGLKLRKLPSKLVLWNCEVQHQWCNCCTIFISFHIYQFHSFSMCLIPTSCSSNGLWLRLHCAYLDDLYQTATSPWVVGQACAEPAKLRWRNPHGGLRWSKMRLVCIIHIHT